MDCKWCDLSERERQWLLFEHGGWSIYLADVQDYIGEFGHHYALKKSQQLKEEDRIALYNLMKAEVI